MLRVLVSTSILLLAVIGCTNYRGKQIPVNDLAPANADGTSRQAEEKLNIRNTKGVVVLSKFVKGDFVRLYNTDGSLWYEFTYFYDDKDGKFEYANEDFRPFAFHQDYFLLALKCTQINDAFYEVVVNEETGLRKHVKANDPVLKLETWDTFVLNVFAVSFDSKTNPPRDAPNAQIMKVSLPTDAIFRPVEINGEWLRVRWGTNGEKKVGTTPNGNGWIRWKNNGTLLVDFYFFS